MQRRFKQAVTSLREHSSVTCAKIATIGGYCDLDLIIVKATSPDDVPLPERYVHELLKIFSISPSSFRGFSLSFSRRFGKTQCWRVALKCLVLLHRLLRSLPDDTLFRTEILCTRSNGLISLYPCNFQDSSSLKFEDYTMFIRSYAQLLDEALDCLSMESKEIERDVPNSLPDKMKELGRIVEGLPQLQSLIDRVMNCRPVGAAAKSFVVQSAMKHIIRDSFTCYTTFRKEIVVVLDNLMQLPFDNCVASFRIYKKAALQADQLCEFYDWCKSIGLCGSYEYPFVDRIPEIQIRALENFLNGMWQLTEASSSTVSPLASTMASPSSLTEDESDRQVNSGKLAEQEDVKKCKNKEETEPLINFDVDNNVSWEALLEASISMVPRNNFLLQEPTSNGYIYEYESCSSDGYRDEVNQWQKTYYLNPFYQHYNVTHYNVSFPSNPTYPWGL